MSSSGFKRESLLIRRIAVDGLLAVALSSSAALAQAPGAIDPGVQLQQQLRDSAPSAPAYDPTDELKPRNGPPSTPTDQPPTDQKSQQTLFLKAVRIQGNTAIREGVLIKPFLPLIGKDITFDQLQAAANQTEAIYKKKGYITTRVLIPSQGFTSGNVVVQVVEGFIEKIEVRGATPGLQQYVKKMLQPVSNAGPKQIFDFKELERQLLLIRDFGGVKFSTSLSKGSELGGSNLVVDLKTDSVHGGLGANNNLPYQLGDWQVSANAQYTVPSSQPLKFQAGGSYSFPYNSGLVTGFGVLSSPLGNQGFKADALWGISSTASKDLYDGPGNLQTIGSSNYWSFGMSYPLILERNSQLSVAIRGTGQNSTNDLYIDGYQVTDLSTDKIRALRLIVDGYTASASSTNTISFQLSQGLGGLNDGLASDEFLSNPYGDSNFTSARLNLSRTQKLFDFGTLFTLKGVGQVSSTPLPVPEAFTYGGPQYGRAFKSVYILGDQGWAASGELAQPIQFSMFKKPVTLTPFIWYDYGSTDYKQGPLPNQTASTYGIGLRGNGLYNTTFELGWGMPATNTLQPSLIGSDNSVVYFNAGWRF